MSEPGPLRPPMPYFGGKITLGRRIADLFPAHRHYVEPFAGALSVLFAKPISAHETVNDLDHKIITFWRVLRDRPHDLEQACALTPHSRAEFETCRDTNADTDLELARQVWVALTQGRAARLTRTGWRHYVSAASTNHPMSAYLTGYLGRFAPAVERLHHVSLECRPALEVIDQYGAAGDVLLYCDPPYLSETRNRESGHLKKADYLVEMDTPAEHTDLAEALLRARAAVVISGYPSPLYDDLYTGWHRVEMQSGTGQGDGWSNRTEVLWSNRPLGNQPALWDDHHEAAS